MDGDDGGNEIVEIEDVEVDRPDTVGLVEIDFHGRSFKAARCKRVLYIEGTTPVLHTACFACLDAVTDIVTRQTAIVADRPKTEGDIADRPELDEKASNQRVQ